MRKSSDLPTDLMEIDTADLWDGPFANLPNELIPYIISYLSLEEYVNFAKTSEKHHQALTQNAFISSYDPQLAIFLKVTVHFVQQTSGKVCEESHTPLNIIKEIMPIYAKVKAQVLTTEIKLKENILIALLDCSLSGMNDDASKKELKWDFLSQIFEKYFKIHGHFIFDMEKLPSVFTDSTKLDYLITCIDQKEAGSFQPNKADIDKSNGSMVAYFYAQSILFIFPNLDKISIEQREIALTLAEGYGITACNKGALNAIFLLRLIYQRLISYKIDSKLSSQQALTPFRFEESVAEFLGIEKLNKKSLYEILGELFFILLCAAPMKTLKVLKKLLARNTLDEVRAVERSRLLSCLIRGKHSLEFLNTFGGKIAKLQEISSTEFLEHICNSPAASMIGTVLKKKAPTCDLIYRELGFEKLVQCSEIIVETRATNLLQALSDLETDQLAKILVDAQGNIESLKQFIITQSIINSSVLPSSVSFFSSSSNKRPHEQTQMAESELTASNPKVPRLSNGKAEEE